ncbi:hypothetical protein GALMADRAFT_219027 [Galerina marginata CBS 339.88]|uniref:Uncharacterized protein n=1 Tax=Galerina marginata (strain CBS 339.88) TaxID=685588 RepID=A0A067TUI8_GALM3|nr:hypothetical protein GALMADRAFT_219027 [Galerina marginata CBS 339.88]
MALDQIPYAEKLRVATEKVLPLFNDINNTLPSSIFWQKISYDEKQRILNDIHNYIEYIWGTTDISVDQIRSSIIGELGPYLAAASRLQNERAEAGLPEREFNFYQFLEYNIRRAEAILKEAERRELGLSETS